MDLTDLDNILLAAIKKTAGNPGRVNRWPQRHLDIETYWVTQYGRVVAFNSVSTVGGIVTTAALSVTSAANLLRCVANMTYFYGYKTGRQVEADDLIGVLALWLGKEPDSSIGQTYGVVKAAHYQLAKSAAINQTRKSITDKVSDSLNAV